MAISNWKLFTLATLVGTGACVSKLYSNHFEQEKYNIAQYHSNPLINPQHQNNFSKKQSGNYVDTYASSQITTHHYNPSSEHKKRNIKKKLSKDKEVVEKEDTEEVKEKICEVKKEICEVKKKVCEDAKEKVCEDAKEKVCEDTEEKVCEDTEEKVCEDTEEKVCEDIEEKACEDTEAQVCEDTKAKVCEDTEAKVCKDTNVEVCEEKRDVCDKEESEEDDGEFDDDERPACNSLRIDSQIKVYSDQSCPTRTIITHSNDWVVYCDSRTRTPFWTVEVIGKCDLIKAEHRHCEAFRVAFKQAEDFRFGNWKNANRLEVELVHVPKRCKAPKEKCSSEIQDKESPDKNYSCDYCKFSAFWHVFHQYIGFLLLSYEYLHVCSGFLYLPEKEPEENEIYEGLPEAQLIPSHFFKVILAKNKDSTYRFECYKIPYERIEDKCVDLRKYLISRDDLQREAGFVIFSDVPICYMKQASTHSCFPPSAAQSFFPANAYTG